MLGVVRTFIKWNYRNQWLEELRMTRKQKSTELSRTMLTLIWLYEQLVNFKCFICTPKVRSFVILLTTDLLELINHDVSWSSMLLRIIIELSSLMGASTGLWHTWTCTVQYTVSKGWGSLGTDACLTFGIWFVPLEQTQPMLKCQQTRPCAPEGRGTGAPRSWWRYRGWD